MVSSSQVGTVTPLSTTEGSSGVPSDALTADTTALEVQLSKSSVSKPEPAFVGEARLKMLGYPDSVIKRLAQARALSTRIQYQSKWILFTSWAEKQKPKAYDPTSPTPVSYTHLTLPTKA